MPTVTAAQIAADRLIKNTREAELAHEIAPKRQPVVRLRHGICLAMRGRVDSVVDQASLTSEAAGMGFGLISFKGING